MNQVTKVTMSQALASNGIKELGKSLELTQVQLANAKSQALRLSSDAKLSKCDPFSIVKFCYESARYNFTRDDCLYPIPYGDKIQAQMGVAGLVTLAENCGLKIYSSLVTNADKVKRDRLTGQVSVEFNEDYDASINAETVGYFAIAVFKDGTTKSKYMSKAECEKHGKRYSKSYGGLWTSDFDKMALKTVVKQLCKSLPQSSTKEYDLLNSALKADQIVYGKENEKDAYLDNPLNDKNINAEMQKSTVSNKLVIDEEVTEKPATEEVSFDDILDDNGEVKTEEETF